MLFQLSIKHPILRSQVRSTPKRLRLLISQRRQEVARRSIRSRPFMNFETQFNRKVTMNRIRNSVTRLRLNTQRLQTRLRQSPLIKLRPSRRHIKAGLLNINNNRQRVQNTFRSRHSLERPPSRALSNTRMRERSNPPTNVRVRNSNHMNLNAKNQKSIYFLRMASSLLTTLPTETMLTPHNVYVRVIKRCSENRRLLLLRPGILYPRER